jgi:hypothetical protein
MNDIDPVAIGDYYFMTDYVKKNPNPTVEDDKMS